MKIKTTTFDLRKALLPQLEDLIDGASMHRAAALAHASIQDALNTPAERQELMVAKLNLQCVTAVDVRDETSVVRALVAACLLTETKRGLMTAHEKLTAAALQLASSYQADW
jgi:hypothetical protein